jgi:hypothetical protein
MPPTSRSRGRVVLEGKGSRSHGCYLHDCGTRRARAVQCGPWHGRGSKVKVVQRKRAANNRRRGVCSHPPRSGSRTRVWYTVSCDREAPRLPISHGTRKSGRDWHGMLKNNLKLGTSVWLSLAACDAVETWNQQPVIWGLTSSFGLCSHAGSCARHQVGW